uniref:Tetraspanin n=1 Tax=Ciona intestinalis TaxID=7719 RepID=F6Y0X5_CIOIN|nr:CD63 antigen-like [Ciona intestinalis]|eukprot:XP_002123552.1 CD63 antigen-like [Ciona intestinalis]
MRNKTGREMGCCENSAKRCLIVLNSLSLLAGLVFIAGGIVITVNLGSYLKYLAVGNIKVAADFLNSAPLIFIGFGAVIFIISLCGCCGAYTEKVWLLKVYKVSLVIILLVLVVIAVLAFCFKSSLRMALHVAMLNFLHTHHKSSKVFNLVQTQLQCCGVDTYMDWQSNLQWTQAAHERADAAGIERHTHPVPDSCCVNPTPNCGLSTFGDNIKNIHLNGCAKTLWQSFSTRGDMVGMSGLVVGGLLLISIVFSCCVINFIRENGGRVTSYA